MNRTIQRIVAAAALWATVPVLALVGPGTARAQDYPSRPISLVVPYPPGGGVDITARAVASGLQSGSGYSVVVENVGGAGGAIGTQNVARAPKDGYTLLMGSAAPLTVLPTVRPSVKYKPAEDFAPVSLVASVPHLIVVSATLPVDSVGDFLRHAKASGRPMAFGSPGPGSVHHLAGELFARATGLKLLQIPYKGTGQMVPDLVAGEVQMTSIEINAGLPLVKAGKVKALAIASRSRSALLPNVPTMIEAGYPDFEITSWFGVLAPSGTAPAIVQKLSSGIQRLGDDPAFNAVLSNVGATRVLSTPEAFQRHIAVELAKWAELVKAAGIQLD